MSESEEELTQDLTATSSQQRSSYLTTRKLTGKFRHGQAKIKNSQGVLLITKEDQVKRWTEHFRDLLNRQPPQLTADITIAPDPLEIDCNPPTKMEIRKAIKALKGGKAEGPDGIPAEALKADIETSTNMLYHLMKTIWEEENVPADWRDGHIVKKKKRRPPAVPKLQRNNAPLNTWEGAQSYPAQEAPEGGR